MTEEFIYERERDLLDFIRNNLSDPENRGTDVVDEEHIAIAGQTEFTLENTLVKNVADLIKVNDVEYRKGHYFKVEYGEGKAVTKVIFNNPLSLNDEVKISYHYGESMIEREFSRTDVTLPRVIIMFMMGDEEFASLGDALEFGKGVYFNVSFRLEIRDKYANRARRITSEAFNLFMKMRHANLFRTNITSAGSLENFDYDRDKEAYIWQFTGDIQWELRFE